jgi:putative radical SAM enzyme (TIGR03279 family)
MKKHIVTGVEAESIARELGIAEGDAVVEVNGQSVTDVFDYRYFTQEPYVELLVEKPDGERLIYEIDKDEYEDIGLVFNSGLMSDAKSCSNKCVFCFVDQLPKNMRSPLYFKDDDVRLSFLRGNYVTLTNMTERDFSRLLFYHLSPVNISVHATDPTLRRFMLNNKNADKLEHCLERISDAGIDMNFQVVLCKGLNDGENLDKTLDALSRYIPRAKSVSVVPVGLTKWRDGLFPIEPFTKEDCFNIIEQIRGWRAVFSERYGSSFVFEADEFYVKSGLPVPPYEYYEDFPQLENGVGMTAMFEREFDDALRTAKPSAIRDAVSVVTGRAAFGFMARQCEKLRAKYPNRAVTPHAVENRLFGSEITVSGLLAARDIMYALRGERLGRVVLLPRNAMREEDFTFLDDVTLAELSGALGVPAVAVDIDGSEFLRAVKK